MLPGGRCRFRFHSALAGSADSSRRETRKAEVLVGARTVAAIALQKHADAGISRLVRIVFDPSLLDAVNVYCDHEGVFLKTRLWYGNGISMP